MRSLSLLLLFSLIPSAIPAAEPASKLPKPGSVVVDPDRGEIILSATVQHPRGKPCIDEYGERVQAFVGCSKAAGGDAKMAGYFVFLVDVPTEEVQKGLIALGAKPQVHYSIQEGKKRTGLKPETTAADYLQGDPVLLSVFWQQHGKWIERPYQHFVTERVLVEGKPIEKPWTPSFAFHGSGVTYESGTGCIACPCDCAGGIIADNRNPIYDPKPMVRFHMERAPKPGTPVFVRIRAVVTRGE